MNRHRRDRTHRRATAAERRLRAVLIGQFAAQGAFRCLLAASPFHRLLLPSTAFKLPFNEMPASATSCPHWSSCSTRGFHRLSAAFLLPFHHLFTAFKLPQLPATAFPLIPSTAFHYYLPLLSTACKFGFRAQVLRDLFKQILFTIGKFLDPAGECAGAPPVFQPGLSLLSLVLTPVFCLLSAVSCLVSFGSRLSPLFPRFSPLACPPLACPASSLQWPIRCPGPGRVAHCNSIALSHPSCSDVVQYAMNIEMNIETLRNAQRNACGRGR